MPARPTAHGEATLPSASPGPGTGPSRFLDLVAIESALLRLQLKLPDPGRSGADPFGREVVANMMSAYAFLDRTIAQGIDIFAMGNLRTLLELNCRVLCGESEASRRENAGHLSATADRFYDQWGAGIRDVVEWHDRHRNEPVHQRAAGVYVRMMSEPQLFLEGNHRTAALVVGYILVRQGEPPFVVTPAIAAAYFDLSAEIQRIHKRSITMLLLMPRLRRRLAALLRSAADSRFLLARAPL